MLFGLEKEVLIIILGFSIGCLFDEIFLNRHQDEKGAHLTFLGFAYFGLIFLLFNSLINFFISIYNLITKNKQKWIKVFYLQRHLVSFKYAVLFILIEILTAGFIGNLLINIYSSNLMNSNNFLINLFLVLFIISSFGYLFFQIVPFRKKKKPFVIVSIILSIIFFVLFFIKTLNLI